MRLYFMSETCPFCPEVTKAIRAFNLDHPFNGIKFVDVDEPGFRTYVDILTEIEQMGEKFGTPAIIFDGIYVTGIFHWKGVLSFLETLDKRRLT